MPEVNRSAQRQVIHRRYAPKTRSGCITCKIRRIKCDEAKPSCKRCTSTGRKCDGYVAAKSPASSGSSPESVQSALTLDVPCDGLEKRTFDYFRSRTAPGISGYFRDAMWNRTILQVSHSEPAVRYAVNALGALHEETFLRRKARQAGITNGECRTSFPIKQYTKAMSELQRLLQSEDTPIEVILLCSIVFMHFEAITESFLPALLHLENSVRLVRSRAASSSKPIDSGIVQAILRMDVQASIYLGMRIPGLSDYPDDSDFTMPSGFRDLIHARDVVNMWTCRVFYFMRVNADDYRFRESGSVPIEIIAKSQELEQTLVELDRLLWEFTQKMRDRLTKREQHGIDMLRSRAKLDRILAGTCVYAEASVTDRYIEVFEEILMLCEYTMHNDDFDTWLFSVSLDEGLVSPLWFVASVCRDGRIRHRALALMRKLPAKEGIWYLEVMTQIAETCVKYEEALCEKAYPLCEDIPEWRRIHSSGLGGWDVSAPKTTVTAHLRTRPNGMDGEWCDIQEPVDFWANLSEKDTENFFAHNIPVLDTAYPVDDPASPLSSNTKWALHTEPWMATLPFQMWTSGKVVWTAASGPGPLRKMGAFGLSGGTVIT